MHRFFCGLIALWFAGPLLASEISFNFNEMPTNQPPAGCTSILGGQGKPGTWKVIQDEVPLALPPISPNAPTTAPGNIVAQLSWDATDDRYPMLLLGTNAFGDFTFSTRFKIADGLTEQTAGVAFRMQDERNYYYIRASATENTFYFFKMVKGVHSRPIGNNIKFKRGDWHTLTVQCSGPNIHISLDGKEALPMLTDPTFAAGKIALWTKSDSISYFTDTHITYTPRESFAQMMVRQVMQANPRVLGLKIYMPKPDSQDTRLVACNDEKEVGQPGAKMDSDVIARGVNYYRKDKDHDSVEVTMPLRDRNGEIIASVRIMMKSFPGQTQDNALGRARPILKGLEQRASSVDRID